MQALQHVSVAPQSVGVIPSTSVIQSIVLTLSTGITQSPVKDTLQLSLVHFETVTSVSHCWPAASFFLGQVPNDNGIKPIIPHKIGYPIVHKTVTTA